MFRECQREGVFESHQQLKEGQVQVGKGTSDEVPVLRALGQNPLKVAEVLRHPLGEEVRGPSFRFGALVLVVEVAGDGVVGFVHLGQQVPDGELKLVGEEALRLGFPDEGQARRQVLEDVGCLCDQQGANPQERRSKRKAEAGLPTKQLKEGGHTAGGRGQPCHVEVRGASVFQGEADEFAATLDGRPIIKLVASRSGHKKTLQAPPLARPTSGET